jgi:hypothetical protein
MVSKGIVWQNLVKRTAIGLDKNLSLNKEVKSSQTTVQLFIILERASAPVKQSL